MPLISRNVAFLRAGVCIFCLVMIVAVRSQGQQVQTSVAVGDRPRPSLDVQRRQEEARQSGGLKAAAAVTGSYVGSAPVSGPPGPANLKELADFSEMIVTGTIRGNSMSLTPDGKSIVTRYELLPDRILKGHAIGSNLTVIIPGGKVSFEGGSWAVMTAQNFQKPMNGDTYLFFLRQAPNELTEVRPAFVPSSGPLGAYRLAPTVGPYVHPSGFPWTLLYKGVASQELTASAFVDRVSSLLK